VTDALGLEILDELRRIRRALEAVAGAPRGMVPAPDPLLQAIFVAIQGVHFTSAELCERDDPVFRGRLAALRVSSPVRLGRRLGLIYRQQAPTAALRLDRSDSPAGWLWSIASGVEGVTSSSTPLTSSGPSIPRQRRGLMAARELE
jgi:hypothetical protein